MTPKFTFLIPALLFCSITFAQQNSSFEKECSISGGIGISKGVKYGNAQTNSWAQLSYRFTQKFSLATEFEFLRFTAPGYLQNFTITPNTQYFYDNYFSLLVKYHLPIKGKFQISVASGWSYYIRQNDYFV